MGTCHYPPNAEADYDYTNKRQVESTADDWLNYPELTGKKSGVSRETWGGPDYQRNFIKWWFAHLPSAEGLMPTAALITGGVTCSSSMNSGRTGCAEIS